MICPHCDKNLLFKERPDRTCSQCGERYALDPRTNSLGLSDARIRRLMAKLTDGGRLKISLDQLGAAAIRKKQISSEDGTATAIGCTVMGVPVGVGLLIAGAAVDGDEGILSFLGVVLLVAVVISVVAALRSGRRGLHDARLSMFRSALLTDWKQVYGSLPAGIVADVPHGAVHRPDRARIALLCPDRAVAAFLAANGMPERYGVAVVTDVPQVPDALPVIVLHDASAAGCRMVLRAREELPGRRVVDGGLPPRAVMKVKDAPVVRGARPTPDLLAELGGNGSGTLTKDELGWLAKGRAVPLIAVRPARLIAAVTRTVERVAATSGPDPDRRRAEAVGFLTWPGEAGR